MKKEQVSFIDTFASLAKINWLSSFKRDTRRLIRTKRELAGYDNKLSLAAPDIVKELWAPQRDLVQSTAYGTLALEIVGFLNSDDEAKIAKALSELVPALINSHPYYDNPASILKSSLANPIKFGEYRRLSNEDGKIVVGRIALQYYKTLDTTYSGKRIPDYKAISFSKSFGLPEYATRLDKRIAYKHYTSNTQQHFYTLLHSDDQMFSLITDTFNMLSAMNVLEGYNTAFSKRDLQQVCQWIKALCPTLSEEDK